MDIHFMGLPEWMAENMRKEFEDYKAKRDAIAKRLYLPPFRVMLDQDGSVLVNTPFTMGWRWVPEAEYLAFTNSVEIEEY